MILYLLCLIIVVTPIIFYQSVLSSKIKLNIVNILMILLMTYMLYNINLYLDIYTKTVMIFFIYCFTLMVFFKKDLKSQILYSLFYLVLTFIIDAIITLYLLYFHYNHNQLLIDYYIIFNIINTLFMSFSMIMITYFNFSKYVIKTVLEYVTKFKFLKFVAYFIFYVLFIILLMYLILQSDVLNYSYNIVLLGFVIFICVYLHYKYEVKKCENNILINKNLSYQKFLIEDKIFKHNIKNKLLAIKSQSSEKICVMIDELFQLEDIVYSNVNEIENIPNSINRFIYGKLFSNKKAVYSVSNKLDKDIYEYLSNVVFYNYMESLGICLDNALEAIDKLAEGFINIKFEEVNRYIITTITNNFDGQIDLDNISTLTYTSKKNNSGLGLYWLRKNKYIKFKVHIKNNTFTICLKVLKK